MARRKRPPTALLAAIGALLAVAGGCRTWTPQKGDVLLTPGRDVPGSGAYTWSRESGWERPVEGTWGTPAQVRTESLEAFAAGAYADALEGFLHLKSVLPPEDPGVAESHFYIAECRYGLGDYTGAVQAYREVYKTGRADEALLNRSFQRIYDIGLDYLSGRAGQSFLFPFIRTKGPSEGIDILIGEQGLVTQYPYLPFADDALMEIARYEYGEESWDEAERIYRRVVTEYPGREWTAEAQYQLAMCVYEQIRGIDYEPRRIQDAERQFRRYLEENPRGRQAEDAREKLRELAEMLGESNLRKAKFYLRENQPGAARIYLRVVLDRYTTTVAAKEAREIVSQLDRVEAGG